MRLEREVGYVPAYAPTGADVEPVTRRPRDGARLTTPEAETVSAAEFEQMKRDLEVEPAPLGRGASTLTKRLAHRPDRGAAAPAKRKPAPDGGARTPQLGSPQGEGAPTSEPPQDSAPTPGPQGDAPAPAPDIAENEGVSPVQKPRRPAKARNRRHGRRR